jgi:hypothetical protein
MDELDAALRDSQGIDRPVVIDAVVDPTEYKAHTDPHRLSEFPTSGFTLPT